MSWRARTAIAIFALAIILLGVQPMLRCMVSATIARHAAGRVDVDGWTTWSAAQNTLTLNQLRIQDDKGGAMQIESISATINPRELLRRNLVIDKATIDGVVIQPAADSVPSIDDPMLDQELSVPTFQASVWADAIRRQCQDRMQRVTDERLEIRAALESHCARLLRRAESLSKLEHNPLRNREYLEEARQEWVAMRQAVAEERVRLREADKELQRDTLRIHEAWPDQLASAIQSTIPNRQQAIQQAVSQRVARYFEDYRTILDVALTNAGSAHKPDSSSHGVDVVLPGVAANYTLVRSANVVGRIEYPDRRPVLFKCKIANWSEANLSPQLRPRLEWRFQLPYEDGSRAIEAEVERVYQDDRGTTKISVAMRENAGQADSDTSRMLCECNPLGTLLELNVPFRGPIDSANPMWIECWDDALNEHGRMQLQVTVRAAAASAQSTRLIAGPIDCSLHPKSQVQLQSLWDSVTSRYAERTKLEASPSVKRAIDGATRARQEAWMHVTSEQNDALARIDEETSRVKLTLDALDTVVERLSRKP